MDVIWVVASYGVHVFDGHDAWGKYGCGHEEPTMIRVYTDSLFALAQGDINEIG